MFKINLVPEVQEKKRLVSKVNYLTTVISLSVLGIVVIVIVVLGGIVITDKALISSTEKKIGNVNTELAQYKELEETVLSLENGLMGAKQILDGNNAWTKLLPHIEKATPADVKYTKLSLEAGKITAGLEGQNISSLARFIESLKQYELYSVTGTGTPDEKISISLDDGAPVEVTVKTTGQWVYPISFNADASHRIIIKNSTDQVTNIVYDSKTTEIKVESGNASIQKKNLFSGIEVTQYRKNGETILFDATMSFDGGLIW
jgi:Tfp pilus assembly protein PilN